MRRKTDREITQAFRYMDIPEEFQKELKRERQITRELALLLSVAQCPNETHENCDWCIRKNRLL